jgi:hypothetical protein
VIQLVFLPENYGVRERSFSFAIVTKASARYEAWCGVDPYVLNFQIFVAPGITPTIPFSSRADEK